MVQDEFEMENQGYEEESSTRPSPSHVKRVGGYLAQSSSLENNSRPTQVTQDIRSNQLINPLRVEPESHVYEDIVVSVFENSTLPIEQPIRLPAVNSRGNNRHNCHDQESPTWSRNSQNDYEKNCLDSIDATSNFHRNLTLPLRRPIEIDESSRFSCRLTNRERTRCNGIDNEPSLYERSIGCLRIVDDDLTKSTTSHVVDKPGRRRRKKDCKHCKSKANLVEHRIHEDSSKDASFAVDLNGRVRANNDFNEERTRLEPILSLPDIKIPVFDSQRVDTSPINDLRTNSIFSITNNANSIITVNNSPKPLNYDKNDTDVRLVAVELTDERALITPQKNRAGMKVNSIYSQEHWSNKDVPIFVTDVKEQTFQRAYSLPTRTQTPSSQNRVNLRRSVRGEPPPHPARLRKNRHGWTLHFARPLDATGCTRSIVLLLIAILALLGIGGIALYIVFEPEKLQIIQQYLRSSTLNVTNETNSTTLASSSLAYEANLELSTLAARSTPVTETTAGFPPETTFSPETETDLPPTTIAITSLDRNATRHCDDCYNSEVCVALVDEEVPICRIGPDPLDPTGCSGLCLINKQKCHRLDVDAFRCVEVEHYCLDDEWTCSNTLCIPLVKHCDGHMNCYDHSDEYDCDCDSQTHFQCGNETSCLPLERRCDGKIDCWDATDEINCTLGQDLGWSCPSSSEFTCSNGECILKARFCDGLRDCTDGSDEPHGCQGRCNKHEFSCLNGRCITKSMKCNGIDDCGDNSDEQHCRDRIFKKPAT